MGSMAAKNTRDSVWLIFYLCADFQTCIVQNKVRNYKLAYNKLNFCGFPYEKGCSIGQTH